VEGSERSPRKAMRYPVKAPVLFRWKDAQGNEHQGEGTSRDISETGAYVLTALSPPLGADIDLRISFMALPNATTTEPVQLDGKVLRVEQIAVGRGTAGFAFLTKEVIFPGYDDITSAGSGPQLQN
jgi:hypothetical protein